MRIFVAGQTINTNAVEYLGQRFWTAEVVSNSLKCIRMAETISPAMIGERTRSRAALPANAPPS
jgi:hypothetical protein